MKNVLIAMLFVVFAACTLPQTTVQSGSTEPGIIIKNAPTDAVLFVDGLQIGLAKQFDGKPKVLAVLEGVHQVEIRQGDNIIYREKTFVSSGETHTVNVVLSAAK